MLEKCINCSDLIFNSNNFYNKCSKCIRKNYINIEDDDDYDYEYFKLTHNYDDYEEENYEDNYECYYLKLIKTIKNHKKP